MAFKFCPECGYKFDRQYKFCPECGYKLPNSNLDSDNLNLNENKLDSKLDDNFDFDFSGLESAFDSQINQEEAQNEEYLNTLQKAKLLCVRGKYLQAKAIYDQLLKENPADINAHIGILRTVSSNLKEYNEDLAEAQFNFLNKFLDKDKLIEAEPEIEKYYGIKEKYFVDKEIAEKEAFKKSEFQKAKDNLKNAKKYKDAFTIYIGHYPQSLKKDDVTILFDEPDKDNGYYLGSDYYFYKLYNKKYFKVEPVCWHTLESRQTFYCDKIIGYTQFSGYVNEYEKSNLKKVIKEFEKEFNPTGKYFKDIRYGSPRSSSLTDKIIDYSRIASRYYDNGSRFTKDDSQIFYDHIFAMQIADVEYKVSNDRYDPFFTDYALEQYRVIKNDQTIMTPSFKYWTRSISSDGYVFMGDVKQKAYKYDNLYDKDEFKFLSTSIAGVKPMISIDINEFEKK